MKILFLTYYFEPDLCAGSFRNSSLFHALRDNLPKGSTLEVITTHPNRYNSYIVDANDKKSFTKNVTVNRIRIPKHKSGLVGQVKSFIVFYLEVLKLVKDSDYDLVYASSSRLFTAFLGSVIARRKRTKLYLDIRDIFRESIVDVYGNSIMKFCLNTIIKPIENYTFSYANHINLVSGGFASYFTKYNKCEFSFYTNGIDDLFLNRKASSTNINSIKSVVYAGNIGEGQGLHLILPILADLYKDSLKFIIYGDGGAKQKLLDSIQKMNIKNIEMNSPVSRDKLLNIYEDADFLFLHLNKHLAFERVIPSKLFEYSAFDKPIIAGVSGYAKDFIEKNLSNYILFPPGNTEIFATHFKSYEYKNYFRNNFIQSFSRSSINKEMSFSILNLK
ncbi:MAG: glycosyltransferase family 4 protein [Flavobacteriaceae bacterium]